MYYEFSAPDVIILVINNVLQVVDARSIKTLGFWAKYLEMVFWISFFSNEYIVAVGWAWWGKQYLPFNFFQGSSCASLFQLTIAGHFLIKVVYSNSRLHSQLVQFSALQSKLPRECFTKHKRFLGEYTSLSCNEVIYLVRTIAFYILGYHRGPIFQLMIQRSKKLLYFAA